MFVERGKNQKKKTRTGNWWRPLFVGFDMSNLPAIGTLALGANHLRGSRGPWVVGRLFRRDSRYAFLLFACEATFFIALESTQFGFESRRK
jgi:hypothetical protein